MINISLVYHRHDRKTRIYHTQSFVLCDIDEESPLDGIGRHENILKSRKEHLLIGQDHYDLVIMYLYHFQLVSGNKIQ